VMKDLSRFWRSLERVHALHAIPAFWTLYCEPHVDLVRPHLRPTDMIGANYPCPYVSRGGHCPRRVVEVGEDQYEAFCSDPYKLCPDVPLTSKDVVVQTLDVGSFTRMLADVLGIRWQPPEQRAGHAWGIGLSRRQKSLNQPVFFVVESSQPNFRSAVLELLASVPGPFVLVAPTDQHREISLQEHFERRGISFVSLAEQVQLDEDGCLVSVESMESPGDASAAVVTNSADGKLSRTAGSPEAVAAVKAYLAAKVMNLTEFSIQSQMTERTARRFLEKGEIQRANFKSMAEAMGLTAEQLLRGELPDPIKRQPTR
jgi:hypothetical protein